MKNLRTLSLFFTIMLSAAYASTTLSMKRYLGFDRYKRTKNENPVTEKKLIDNRESVLLLFKSKHPKKSTNTNLNRKLQELQEEIHDYKKRLDAENQQVAKRKQLKPLKKNKGSRNLRQYMAPKRKNNQPFKLPDLSSDSDSDHSDCSKSYNKPIKLPALFPDKTSRNSRRYMDQKEHGTQPRPSRSPGSHAPKPFQDDNSDGPIEKK